MALSGEILRRLGDLVGSEHLSDNHVVFPGTAEEVASVLRLAHAERLRVLPVGNSSQLDLGAPCPEADLTLCLRRLNRLRQYEPADLTASVDAGLTMAELSAALSAHRQWLPLGVPRPDRATVGGALATNTSGPFRVFYGAARDLVIGMRFATAEGKLVKSGGMVVKNVAGYDMAKLLIGSLGTLAVITDVNFKVFPHPTTETTVLTFRSLADALEARSALLKSVVSPLALDLLDAAAAALVENAAPHALPGGEFLLAIAYGGVESVVQRCRREVVALGQAARSEASVNLAGEQEQRFWAAICDLPATFSATDPGSVRLKLSCALQEMRPLLELVLVPPRPASTETALVARAGSGISYIYARGGDLAAFCRKTQELALSLGAHAVIEFAPPAIKAQLDVWGPRRDDYPIMQKLKQAFDPYGILNPGRFVC